MKPNIGLQYKFFLKFQVQLNEISKTILFTRNQRNKLIYTQLTLQKLVVITGTAVFEMKLCVLTTFSMPVFRVILKLT